MGFTWAITCAHNAMRSGEVPAGAISGTEAGVAGGGWAGGGATEGLVDGLREVDFPVLRLAEWLMAQAPVLALWE